MKNGKYFAHSCPCTQPANPPLQYLHHAAGNDDDHYFSPDLRLPTCFAAANVIDRDSAGDVRYHYTIVEVWSLGFRVCVWQTMRIAMQ